MFRRLCPTVLLNLLILALAPALWAAPPDIHQRLVRIDRELQATAAGLSLGAPPRDAGALRRAETELAALAGELATATQLADREALIEKVRLLRRQAAEVRAATRAAEPASPVAGRPRPTPLVDALPGHAPAAPPGNDACSAALPLTLGATATGSLAEASNDGQASCGSSLFASDVWYRFDPPDYGYYSVDSLGSNFDTVLSLHEGCPGTLDNQELCNDDGLGLSSALSFYGYPGSSVWLRVAGYGGDRGSYQIQLGTGGTITGILRAADTNAVRSGVRVEAYGTSSFPDVTATTGADGRFTLTNLRAGLYRVWADGQGEYLDTPHGGCPNGAETCARSAAPAVAVSATGTVAGIDILQRRGAAITGRVTRGGGGALAGVTLVAWDPANERQLALAETDINGLYRLEPLPTGAWTVYTSEGGLVNEAWPNQTCDDYYCGTLGTPISVPSGGTVAGIDFVLDQLGSLSGRVTDQATGLPIADSEVQIYTAGGSWVGYDYTDATGAYSFTGLSAGSYRATAAGDYGGPYAAELYLGLPCGQSCQVSAGTPITVTVNANTPSIDFSLTVRGSLTGRVTSTGGTSLPAVWVRLYGSDGYLERSVVTDANGNYLFTGVDAGSYFLRTDNTLGWLDEVFDDHPCGPSCDVRTGTPVVIQNGQTTLAHFS
ncbi:MAG: carboxypeptidase regulatory-like domain-containing protein, partial [Thermoanaerobaculia bacterium]|nr:carboxypeptidase regulatory-like domain-containing protein [Thermoanaerobaculia bacterium]